MRLLAWQSSQIISLNGFAKRWIPASELMGEDNAVEILSPEHLEQILEERKKAKKAAKKAAGKAARK